MGPPGADGRGRAERRAGRGAPGRDRVRAFFPSLHLNLAADYLKLQRPESARIHLDRAWDAAGVLGDDGYGGGVRAAIGRLEQRMRGSAAGSEAGPPMTGRPAPYGTSRLSGRMSRRR